MQKFERFYNVKLILKLYLIFINRYKKFILINQQQNFLTKKLDLKFNFQVSLYSLNQK